MPPSAPEEVIPGGSLTRPNGGRRQTLQAHGIHPSPDLVQRVWSSLRQRLHSTAWDGQPLGDEGYVISWTEAREARCRSCGWSLGKYVAYQARDEFGIVEDTAHIYDLVAGAPVVGQHRPKHRPRFVLQGQSLGYAKETRAVFHCGGCRQRHVRNLAKLGKRLFEDDSAEPFFV